MLNIEFNFSFISKVTWSFSIPIVFGGSFLPIIDTMALKKLSLFQSVYITLLQCDLLQGWLESIFAEIVTILSFVTTHPYGLPNEQ